MTLGITTFNTNAKCMLMVAVNFIVLSVNMLNVSILNVVAPVTTSLAILVRYGRKFLTPAPSIHLLKLLQLQFTTEATQYKKNSLQCQCACGSCGSASCYFCEL